jgi:hypothetical protein
MSEEIVEPPLVEAPIEAKADSIPVVTPPTAVPIVPLIPPQPEAAQTITIRFTWRGFYRASFIMVAEAAMLALVFESSGTFKVATLICALLGLGLLQFDGAIKRWSKRAFRASIWIVSLTYGCFVVYALWSFFYDVTTRRELANLYVESLSFASRPIALNAEKNHLDDAALNQFRTDVVIWQNKTAQLLANRMGTVAAVRFLDKTGYQDLNWTQNGNSDPKFSEAMNMLASDRKNLAVILETRAYDR